MIALRRAARGLRQLMPMGAGSSARAAGAAMVLALFAAVAGHAAEVPEATETAATHYFVKSGLIIDPASGETIAAGMIEISGGRIMHVGESSDFDLPADARVLDYGSKVVIPGLVDVHGHFYTSLTYGHSSNESVARLYLPAGVTAVLSPGSGNPDGDFALQQLIDSGRLDGPRLFLAGEYLDMEPLQAPWMDAVATEREARLKLGHWAGRGADAVKVYAGMQGAVLRATIAHAHSLGLKVHGHLGATSWSDAIAMGIDAIHHGIYAFPEITPEDMPPLAMGAALFAPPELGWDRYYAAIAQTDLAQPKVREVLAAAARAKVVLVPTLVALSLYDRTLDHMDEQQPYYAPDAWQKVEQRFLAKKNPHAAALLEKNLELARRAHEAGCLIATGTDVTTLQILPGYSLWREMELLAEAGLEPMEVLKAATVNGAFAIGTDQIGSLAAGKWADFVVLDANPLENISNVRRVHRVVKGGVIYDPEALRAPLRGKVH